MSRIRAEGGVEKIMRWSHVWVLGANTTCGDSGNDTGVAPANDRLRAPSYASAIFIVILRWRKVMHLLRWLWSKMMRDRNCWRFNWQRCWGWDYGEFGRKRVPPSDYLWDTIIYVQQGLLLSCRFLRNDFLELFESPTQLSLGTHIGDTNDRIAHLA